MSLHSLILECHCTIIFQVMTILVWNKELQVGSQMLACFDSEMYFIYACPNLSRKHIQPLSKLAGKMYTVIGKAHPIKTGEYLFCCWKSVRKKKTCWKPENYYYSDINIYLSKYTSLPVLTGCNCQGNIFCLGGDDSLGSLTVQANTKKGLI